MVDDKRIQSAHVIQNDKASQTQAVWQRCYLGLGSNLTNELGTPSEHIQNALESLKIHPKVEKVRSSSLYLSKPMGPQDQPDFVNAVVELETTLSPSTLLDLCQSLEQAAHRMRLRRWGERSLDVDIVLYGDEHINTPELTIPHACMLERNFVLVPLAELNPNLIIHKQMISKMALSQDWTGLSILNDTICTTALSER